MFLSGPAPSFVGVGVKLASQGPKGIKDNVQHYRRRRQSGRGILGMEALPKSGTNSERTRGIREWVSRVPLAVTTDVPLLGKYESLTQTTSVLGGHSQRSQSVQTSRDADACHCRSDQRCQRDGTESVEESNSRQASHDPQAQVS